MIQYPLREIEITRMRESDLEQVVAIEKISYPSPWPESAFASELSKERTCYYLVAKHGEQVAGYSGMWVTLDEGHVTTLAVHPEFRRQRIASRLLLQNFNEAYKRNLHCLTLEVRITNEAAKSMYQKFGLQKRGYRKGYYLDNNEDAEIWTSPYLHTPEYQEFIRRMKESILNPEENIL